MGHVYVNIKVRGSRGEAMLREVLVDTGATLTVLPEDVLEMVGAWPSNLKVGLELGDGRTVEAKIYGAVIEVGGREGLVAVATFKGAKPMLGVLALETLGLRVDPVTNRLEETRPKGIYYFYYLLGHRFIGLSL